MTEYKDDEYETINSEPSQLGGGDSDKSFVEYITSFSPTEKSQIMNLVQYCGIAILPLLTVLKLMKNYMPINNPLKPSSELIFEVIVQLIVILVSFFFVHKLVLYVPTYSQVNYEKISLLSGMLPLLFLMFTLDTKISEKLNVLFDRLLEMLGLLKEPLDEDEQNENNQEGSNKNRQVSGNNVMQSTGMNAQPSGMHTTSIEELSGMSGGMQNAGFEGFEPLPANY